MNWIDFYNELDFYITNIMNATRGKILKPDGVWPTGAFSDGYNLFEYDGNEYITITSINIIPGKVLIDRPHTLIEVNERTENYLYNFILNGI